MLYKQKKQRSPNEVNSDCLPIDGKKKRDKLYTRYIHHFSIFVKTFCKLIYLKLFVKVNSCWGWNLTLQTFTLTKTPTGQHIVHEEEQPPYRYELDVPCDDAVDAKVFVIDDLTHSPMLLAEEY